MLLDRGVIVRAGDGGYRVTGAIAEHRDPRDAARPGRRAPRRPVRGRAPAAAAGRRARQVVHARRARRGERPAADADRRDARRRSRARSSSPCRPIPRSPERGQYGFVQDMVRTIARDTLGRRERKRLHLATADHLARLGGDELAEVIAAHRLDAYRLLPDDPDAAELRDGARADILRAADRAASLAAPEEAYRLVTEALDLVPDGPEQAALHERAGAARAPEGRRRRRRGRVHAVRSRSTSAPATRLPAARVRARRGDVLFLDGRAEAGRGRDGGGLRRARRRAGRRRPRPPRRAGRPAVRDDRRRGPRPRRARAGDRHRRDASAARGALERPQHQGPVDHRVHAPPRGGALAAARRAAGRARTDQPQAAMRAYFNLSFEREGVDDHSHEYDADGLALAERVGDEQWKRSFLLHTSHAAIERGDWDEALRHHARGRGDARRRVRRLRARHPAHPRRSSSPAAGDRSPPARRSRRRASTSR